MQIPDLINGIFEFGMGLAVLSAIFAIRKHQDIKGTHWSTFTWAGLWGLYNLYFYPHLDQWFSFTGGCFIVSANIVWLGHAIYYMRKNNDYLS